MGNPKERIVNEVCAPLGNVLHLGNSLLLLTFAPASLDRHCAQASDFKRTSPKTPRKWGQSKGEHS
jgi:hypothetical protein